MDFKKWGILLLALLMLLAFAVGCDNGADVQEDDADTAIEDSIDDGDEMNLEDDLEDFPVDEEEEE